MTAEDLGGADVHCRISGVTDHYATDEAHGLALARRIVANLNPPRRAELAVLAPEDPLFDPAELAGIVPSDARKVRCCVARLGWGRAVVRAACRAVVCGRAPRACW